MSAIILFTGSPRCSLASDKRTDNDLVRRAYGLPVDGCGHFTSVFLSVARRFVSSNIPIGCVDPVGRPR